MDAAVIWDGIGSNLVGGVLGGLVVFGGIWWTQKLQDRSAGVQARNQEAALLVEQVANARDVVVFNPTFRSDFHIWPLRNRMMMAAPLFKDRRALDEVGRFAFRVERYRSWLRNWESKGRPFRNELPDWRAGTWVAYTSALHEHGDRVIKLLQNLEDPASIESFEIPAYPDLPYHPPAA